MSALKSQMTQFLQRLKIRNNLLRLLPRSTWSTKYSTTTISSTLQENTLNIYFQKTLVLDLIAILNSYQESKNGDMESSIFLRWRILILSLILLVTQTRFSMKTFMPSCLEILTMIKNKYSLMKLMEVLLKLISKLKRTWKKLLMTLWQVQKKIQENISIKGGKGLIHQKGLTLLRLYSIRLLLRLRMEY